MSENIANAKLMANYGVAFNIGADILNKGNRAVDKYLGSDKKSGDTVYVPIMDSGEVYENMDLTGLDLSVQRDEVAVQVTSLTAAAMVSVEDLTLSIDNPEIMSKRVAKLANKANLRGYRTLVDSSQAFVSPSKQPEDIRATAFDAEAYATGSKLGGSTYGCTHPTTFNRMASSLSANFAPNDKLGKELYSNDLGDFMGFKWSKGSDTQTVLAVDVNFGTVTLANGSAAFIRSSDGPANPIDGQLTDPFTVNGVYACDALGVKTGVLKTFRARWNASASDWILTAPVWFIGARQNAWTESINGKSAILGANTVDGTYANQLVPGTSYLAPAVIWKEADFLVAVKGLEKFHGCDSYTVPTQFKERGILPLRGTVFTDPVKAGTIFRVDVLLGTEMYQSVSNASFYLQS
jgi:hypothetical protein